MIKRLLVLLCILPLIVPTKVTAQYDAHEAFAPLDYVHPPNRMRSANGTPGVAYWQNEADYDVKVKFDTSSKVIEGDVLITYTNNSPDKLSNLWLQLVQNIDRNDARAARIKNPSLAENDKGFHLSKVSIMKNGQRDAADYLIDGTRMQVRLQEPLKGDGGAIKLHIDFSYQLQESSRGGRSGYMDTENGRLYEVSYWYPRMCVYDDMNGWNTLPFLGYGEFYLDYGDISYSITLPAGLLVTGSGVLDNPKEVLTQKELKRLGKAKHSDKTVLIRGKDDLNEPATKKTDNGWLTWHFHMNDTRDVAWAASEAFLWDAARINLPDDTQALAMSFYPVESASDSCHGRGTEYLKAAVESFSEWYPYPYRTAINVGGKVVGMEFPGLAMNWWKAKEESLFALLVHEIGHSWYPMIVGSNERRYPWMDEGVNTFIDLLTQNTFNDGEYAPKRDGEYAPGGGNPADEIVSLLQKRDIKPIMTRADAFAGDVIHPVTYFKAAFGLVLLRNVILGKERFDYAFKQYTKAWAYEHPSPADFFRAINNFAGADLNWFWRGWFYNNWQLDQAVKSVKYVDGKPEKGANVTIENLKKLPMPVIVKVIEENGNSRKLKLPVEVWEKDGEATFKVNTTSGIKEVLLDPDKVLPDVDRGNNIWLGS
ncbi:MAG TPA: M1 family metallopeptidase [Chitinophagaceae bacterium]|nr:M1 family metallopeptidase [Chitinophagaceae bacterium]